MGRIKETLEQMTRQPWWCHLLGHAPRDILIPRPPLIIHGEATWVPPTKSCHCRRCGKGSQPRAWGYYAFGALCGVLVALWGFFLGWLIEGWMMGGWLS